MKSNCYLTEEKLKEVFQGKDDDPDWELNSYKNNKENKKIMEEKNNKEQVSHPKHYNREDAMEAIDEMLLLFGKEEVKSFCKLNAWKYRYRAADKNGEEDLKKSDWYINKYKELCKEDEVRALSYLTVSDGPPQTIKFDGKEQGDNWWDDSHFIYSAINNGDSTAYNQFVKI